ncbi:ATP-binding protein [Rhizobium jaguaris]|uniref:OmpR/PhoB-type domain-containing protein n=1 Tax=Rhizobium jaguaris TaxID=1312183 RepID=A0A387FME8_9HYPH|nr:winged helix-turn-helix domain-containing protein [Rhizobium jaguaris]AYG59978.1 hypothetical protein CCGE525_15030 [Rhizobium jaguaris]
MDADGNVASLGRRSGSMRPSDASLDEGYLFDRFCFYPGRGALLENGKEVKLGGRAVKVLATLVERSGEVISKEEIIRAVWPSTFVDEGNLRVHIAALRKALGQDRENTQFISNIVGRGYQFTGRVSKVRGPVSANAIQLRLPDQLSNDTLPAPLARIVGRAEAIDGIVQLVSRQRLVTIVGAGGIGKTTIALAAAQRLSASFNDGVFFIDLAAVSDAGLVPFAVAAELNISAEAANPIGSLVAHVRQHHALIILDNCEHVIGGAAELVEGLLRGAKGLRIIATSHERLRTEGEWLYRLSPLEVPKAADDLLLEEAISYPSVELFVERATSDNPAMTIGEADVPFIVEICRKLDGIPLAIEIAAARVEVFGIAGLLENLEDRLDVQNGGRRTAVDRHRTIRSMLDWSYEILDADERVVLRRLSVFAGSFSMDAAVQVAACEMLTPQAVMEGVSGLVRKSLLYSSMGPKTVSYRFLESTKLYGREKLADMSETSRSKRLHVEYVIDVLIEADAKWKDTGRSIWIERYSPLLDDIRDAMSHCFHPEADHSVGVRLTALAMPLGLQLGLVDEFRERARKAIAAATSLPKPDLVSEMRLNIIYGILVQNQHQPTDDNIVGLTRAALLSEEIGQDRHRIEPQIVLAAFNMGMGKYAPAITHAEMAERLGQSVGDDLAVVASQRILSQVNHFNGDHARASKLAKAVLAHPVVNIPTAYGGLQTDRRVSMRIILARALWMTGKPDQAIEVVRKAEEIARADGPLALCQALALAVCPILLWRGGDDLARQAVTDLLEQSLRFTLSHWHSWGRMFESVLQHRATGEDQGLPVIETQGDLQAQTLATLTGQLVGLEADAAGEDGWCAPEVIRAKGGRAVAEGRYGEAERLFRRSISVAQTQEALSWELRSVTSLARLLACQGRVQEAKSAVRLILEQFSEGVDTRDLVDARSILSLR